MIWIFFAKKIIDASVDEFMEWLAQELGGKLIRESSLASENMAKVIKCYIGKSKEDSFKIDFIEDHFKCFESDKCINGIDVMSLDALYVRKLYAFAGIIPKKDPIEKSIPAGGRQSAKDVFDLYHLSNSYKPLSKFCHKFFKKEERDMLAVKSRIVNRFDLTCELVDIETEQVLDAKKIIHEVLNKQIDQMMMMELD